MGSFDSLDTAARVRDIIKRGASRQIQTDVPRPLVGRVVSVNLPNLKAMIWFTGDQQPVEVNLFSTTIPGQWARRGFPSDVVSTETEGFGSMAVCQRFNGLLYVTDVITGGQFGYNLSTVNLAVAELLPWDGSGDVAGENARSTSAVRVSSNFVSIDPGGGVMFGPFLMPGNNSPSNGNTQITVSDGVSLKHYNFDFIAYTITETIHSAYLDRWYRLLPAAEGNYSTNDWDLDIAYRETAHGLDRDSFQSQEIWFRLVVRTPSASVVNHTVSLDSNLFTRNQGFDRQYVCEVTQSASDPVGYLGFHQPDTSNDPIHDRFCMDQFGRTHASSLGNADTGETWQDDTAGGSTDGKHAILALSASGQTLQKSILPDVQGASLINVEVFAVVSTPVTASGDDLKAAVVWRETATNNYYRAAIIFKTTGLINWEIVKRISGSDTTLNSGTTGFTYSPSERFGMRVRMNGTGITFKFWKYDTEDERNATARTATDGAIAVSGRVGIRAVTGASNSNTYPVNMTFHEFRGGNSIEGRVMTDSVVEWRTGPYRNARLRLAELLQRTLYCTSLITWDGSRLTWTGGSIYLGSVGRHRDSLREGEAFCSMPANTESIPIIPNGGFATVNSSGIPLSAGQSLWLGVPPGVWDEDIKDHLFIVDDSGGSDRLPFGIPEWAVLIAAIPYQNSAIFISGLTGTGELQLAPEGFFVDLSMTPGTKATGTYSDLPGSPAVTIVKRYAGTRLRITMVGTFFSATAQAGITVGATVNGSDVDIAQLASTNASLGVHTPYSGFQVVSSVPAGSQTITGRWKRQGGTGTLTLDNADTLHMSVKEII